MTMGMKLDILVSQTFLTSDNLVLAEILRIPMSSQHIHTLCLMLFDE